MERRGERVITFAASLRLARLPRSNPPSLSSYERPHDMTEAIGNMDRGHEISEQAHPRMRPECERRNDRQEGFEPYFRSIWMFSLDPLLATENMIPMPTRIATPI